jgi:hypothetical protein
MSMNATFVQIDQAELSKLQADPSLAEGLFQDGPLMPPAFTALAKTMQDRVKTSGPQLMAGVLSRLDPKIREQLEERLGRTTSDLAGGAGGEALLKLMEARMAKGAGFAPAPARTVLSLDKAWHGVHYVLCGELEPGPALLSQAVMGGVELGDSEGFSGYGPARYFTSAEVVALSEALSGPEVEQQAASRFDAARMSELQIYPGWRASDAEWVMDSLRRLRDFYADAAGKGRAIVTCLV